MEIRLQKYLADMGISSRRKCEEYIVSGFVKVNGVIEKKLGTKIDPEKDKIEFDQNEIKNEKSNYIYYVLNKPVGYVTTTNKNEFEEKIVLDLIPKFPRVYPVGRLDKDTTGLLLLTNDGEMTYRLMHPSFDHEKEYEVLGKYKITESDIKKLSNGEIIIEGRKIKQAKVISKGIRTISIILTEGMKRQIRKMLEKIGNRVEKLRRIRVENIFLGDLPIGKYRILNEEEVNELKKRIGL